MSLKFKRNLPTLFLLVGILFSLAVFMGDQTITSYSFDIETLRTAIQFNASDGVVQLAKMSAIQAIP
jgi:hypothetical protein